MILTIFSLLKALYFDRYQKLLAPGSDPLRDPVFRDYLNREMSGGAVSGPHSPSGTGTDSRAPRVPASMEPSVRERAAGGAGGGAGATGSVDSDWVIDTEILQ